MDWETAQEILKDCNATTDGFYEVVRNVLKATFSSAIYELLIKVIAMEWEKNRAEKNEREQRKPGDERKNQ